LTLYTGSGSHVSLAIEGAILLVYTSKTIGENDMEWSHKIIYMYSHSKIRIYHTLERINYEFVNDTNKTVQTGRVEWKLYIMVRLNKKKSQICFI
jgi:hypothetical protein